MARHTVDELSRALEFSFLHPVGNSLILLVNLFLLNEHCLYVLYAEVAIFWTVAINDLSALL
ncbi:hypothetical protein V8C43DRAFT_274817 [Trichoderma afarasin]